MERGGRDAAPPLSLAGDDVGEADSRAAQRAGDEGETAQVGPRDQPAAQWIRTTRRAEEAWPTSAARSPRSSRRFRTVAASRLAATRSTARRLPLSMR